jgi:flagellar motor switch/type III secretory pathway protein FliN
VLRERDRPSPGPGPACGPFPWASLDALSRRDVGALTDVRRWAATQVGLEAVGGVLRLLLDAPLEVRIRRVEDAARAQPLRDALGVLVAPAGRSPAGGALIVVEGALAGALAARALRRPPPVLVKPALPSPGIAGALAAVIAATARRAHAEAALEVQAAGPAGPLEVDFHGLAPDALAVTVTVLLGDDAYAARVVVARQTVRAVPGPPWSGRALSRLGAMPLAVPIVARAVESTVADVAALGPGDVFVPGAWRVPPGTPLAGLTAPVLLAPPSATVGVRADLVDGRRIVLRGQGEPLCAAEATTMRVGDGRDGRGGRGGDGGDAGGESALVSAIGEVPVVVRVEVGEAVMSAREWASLAPGDVVGLGTRVGDRVVLRVGGVPVARGELVDIEGEVGVRIVARLAEDPTSP